MTQLYSSQIGVPKEAIALAPMGMARYAGTEGTQALGATVAELGMKLQATRDARDMAQATADYNKLVDDYKETLVNKDPREFVAGYDAMKPKFSKILQGKSRKVQDELYNNFAIWGEKDRADIARASIGKEVSLTRDMIAQSKDNALLHDQKELHFKTLDGLTGVLNQREIDLYKQDYLNDEARYNQQRAADIEKQKENDAFNTALGLQKQYGQQVATDYIYDLPLSNTARARLASELEAKVDREANIEKIEKAKQVESVEKDIALEYTNDALPDYTKIDSSVLPADKVIQAKKLFDDKVEKMAKGIEYPTDNATLDYLETRIQSTRIGAATKSEVLEEILLADAGDKLGKGVASSLTTKLNTEYDQRTTELITDGNRVLENTILTKSTGGIQDTITGKIYGTELQNHRLILARNELESSIQQLQAEKTPITRDIVTKLANDIGISYSIPVATYEVENAKFIADKEAQRVAIGVKRLKATEAKKPDGGTKQRLPNETVSEYLKRTKQ